MRREAYLFSKLLLSTYHVPSPTPLFAHLIFIIPVLSSPPFYRRGNQGTEKLSNVPKVTQLVTPGFEPRQPDYKVWTPNHLGQCCLLLCCAAFPPRKCFSLFGWYY